MIAILILTTLTTLVLHAVVMYNVHLLYQLTSKIKTQGNILDNMTEPVLIINRVNSRKIVYARKSAQTFIKAKLESLADPFDVSEIDFSQILLEKTYRVPRAESQDACTSFYTTHDSNVISFKEVIRDILDNSVSHPGN